MLQHPLVHAQAQEQCCEGATSGGCPGYKLYCHLVITTVVVVVVIIIIIIIITSSTTIITVIITIILTVITVVTAVCKTTLLESWVSIN